MSSEIVIHPHGSGTFVWRDTGAALRPVSFVIPKELAGEFGAWIKEFRRLAKGSKKGNGVSMEPIDNIGRELSKKLSLALGESVTIIYRAAFVAPPIAPAPLSKKQERTAKLVRDLMHFLRSPEASRRIVKPKGHVDIYRAGRRLPGHYGANQ